MNRAMRDIELLLIDGNNLLHRMSGSVEAVHQRALFARLRAALPGTRKIVVFDGRRSAQDEPLPRGDALLEVRHAGGSADDLLVELVRQIGPAEQARTVLVTDDRALTERARGAGARTQRLAWLVALIDRPGRPGGMARTREQRPPGEGDLDEEGERRPWQPGRGATRKRGNPRRAKSSRRTPPPR